MNILYELQTHEQITTGEAITGLHQLHKRYAGVLANLIRIKSETPVAEEEQFSRRRPSPENKEVLQELLNILNELDAAVIKIEQNLMENH